MRIPTAAILAPLLLAPLLLALAGPAALADPPPAPAADPYAQEAEEAMGDKVPDRERELIQIVEDARTEAKSAHTYKNARMGMQIRIANFYDKSHDLLAWQGTVAGTRSNDQNDVWLSIKIADGMTVATSPTRSDDPDYVTLIKGGTPLAAVAASLRTGQRVRFSATLLRFVIDSDDDMVNNPRLLAHFTAVKPLD